MKAHEYARILLAGPDLEVLHLNHDSDYPPALTEACIPRVLTHQDALNKRYDDWNSLWGEEAILIDIFP